MIGQKNVIDLVTDLAAAHQFPRFLIITGEAGSGRKTLAHYIAHSLLNAYTVTPGNGVDSVREAVENAYKCQHPTVYLFADADKMSAQAKNALLKITEEPPRQAYFIMTVLDMANTLATLKSRGTEIRMDPYTKEQLAEIVPEASATVLWLADNPGNAKKLMEIDHADFLDFCEKIVDNIDQVTGTNAFKIGLKIKIKEDDNGYDPILLFNCIIAICLNRIQRSEENEDILRYAHMIKVCSKYKNELRITGLKKDATIDMWILDMRRTLSQ